MQKIGESHLAFGARTGEELSQLRIQVKGFQVVLLASCEQSGERATVFPQHFGLAAVYRGPSGYIHVELASVCAAGKQVTQCDDSILGGFGVNTEEPHLVESEKACVTPLAVCLELLSRGVCDKPSHLPERSPRKTISLPL